MAACAPQRAPGGVVLVDVGNYGASRKRQHFIIIIMIRYHDASPNARQCAGNFAGETVGEASAQEVFNVILEVHLEGGGSPPACEKPGKLGKVGGKNVSTKPV